MGFAKLTTLLPTPTPKTFDNCRKLTFLPWERGFPPAQKDVKMYCYLLFYRFIWVYSLCCELEVLIRM